MNFQLYYLSLFTVFAIVAYMMAVDSNVSRFVVLLFRWVLVKTITLTYWVRLYPRRCVDRIEMRWRRRQVAKRKLKNSDSSEEESKIHQQDP